MLLALPFPSATRILRRALLAVVSIAFLLVTTAPGSAQELRGNIKRGRVVADAQCGECHPVGYEGPWMRGGIPSFPAIADLPSTTALSLRVTLQTTHTRTRMPNLILSQSETDDVIAYILGLVRK